MITDFLVCATARLWRACSWHRRKSGALVGKLLNSPHRKTEAAIAVVLRTN